MNTASPIDWDEMFEYLPGTIVELNSEPGVLYQIDCYKTCMVPPIWLVGDPRPRYPHQMRIVSRQQVKACELELEPSFA
ncbi:hypothetical protein [Synechocystis sp. PCC 7338]|uniref:hypothetical protein n=1 Tax=Synechocystis sp. PCC 7338 TaxID=2732530 RepID=UPI001BAE73B4|nr:hypothetical protein [Synechocystis sp. PCC 7338]QUS61585.1 hypothetical protein HTZ78_13575 [Synechocystis sp. PCC 7338]